jgi:hypothetical protein
MGRKWLSCPWREVKEDEMGGTCIMHKEDEKCIYILMRKSKKRNHLGDVDV